MHLFAEKCTIDSQRGIFNEYTVAHDAMIKHDSRHMSITHSRKSDMVAFYTMFAGTFFLCISQSMMINALPSIMTEFSISAEYGQLITTGYIFGLGLFSAMSAVLVDRYSTRSLCLVSFAAFIAGCIVCIFAPDFTTLLIGRLLQAGGAGISLPLIQNVALIIYPENQYGKAMGAVGLIIGFAPALGPAVAGPIIDMLGWRAVFVILGVCVAGSAVLAAIFVRNLSPCRDAKFNVPSAILLCAGSILVMAGLTHAEASSIGDPLAWAELAAGFAILAVYAIHERKSADPLLHLGSFRSKRFSVDCILIIFGNASMMIASIMIPLYVQGVQGDSATMSGFVIMPGAILLGLLNPVAGRLYDKYGARPLALVGGLLIFAGTAAFVPCTAETPAWAITLIYGIRTIGIACIWTPMVADAAIALPPAEKAQATAISTSLRQTASAMLATVFVSIMSTNSPDASGISDYGFDISFTALAAFSLAMLVFTALCVRWKHTPRKTGRTSGN
jgi:EmrB/QacA subfamily drug resistance transporter